MLFKSIEGAGREKQLSSAAAHPAAQHSEPGLGRLLRSSYGEARSIASRVLTWTQSEEQQERERANQSPQSLFPASGRGGVGEVYFRSCGCSSRRWPWGGCVHGLCPGSCWCCAALVAGSKLVEKVGKDRKCGIFLFSTN